MTGEGRRCDRCGRVRLTAHTLILDSTAKYWHLCCWCLTDLISWMESTDVDRSTDAGRS